MTDNDRAAFAAKLLGGYTEEQLSAAFDMVKNVHDWRAPIHAQILLADFNGPLIKYAIEFYTATTPTFAASRDGLSILVSADGYRKGPAGDH